MPHVHNALHHFTAIQAAYRKWLGEDDAAFNGIERAGETLTPILDPWSAALPEIARLRGEKNWMVNPSQSATVAEFGLVAVSNPVGSGLIVVVDGCMVLSGVAHTYRIGANITFDSTSTPVAVDTRWPQLGQNCLTNSHAHAQAALAGFNLANFSTRDQRVMMPLKIVLSPGFFFGVSPDAQNVTINATFWGRERLAFDGELG